MSGGGQGNGFGSYGSSGQNYGGMSGPSNYGGFGAPQGDPYMGGRMSNAGYPSAFGQPQGDPYMGSPMNFPTSFPQQGQVMDGGGMQNFMPQNYGMPQQQQQLTQAQQQQAAGPPMSGPGSLVAYLQSQLQQDPSQQATQLTNPPPDMGKVGTPASAANPLAAKVGNFNGSPNTWLYGPTVGSLYPQLQKPQGTPNNFGYMPASGTWGLPPGQS